MQYQACNIVSVDHAMQASGLKAPLTPPTDIAENCIVNLGLVYVMRLTGNGLKGNVNGLFWLRKFCIAMKVQSWLTGNLMVNLLVGFRAL